MIYRHLEKSLFVLPGVRNSLTQALMPAGKQQWLGSSGFWRNRWAVYSKKWLPDVISNETRGINKQITLTQVAHVRETERFTAWDIFLTFCHALMFLFSRSHILFHSFSLFFLPPSLFPMRFSTLQFSSCMNLAKDLHILLFVSTSVKCNNHWFETWKTLSSPSLCVRMHTFNSIQRLRFIF